MILTSLENLLNRHLARSPAARALLVSLRDQRLVIVMRDPDERFALDSAGSSLRLSRLGDDAAPAAGMQAEIEGRPVALLAMAMGRPERMLQSGDVKVSGDAEVLQRYRDLLGLLRPDLEELFAELLGDAPAHQLGRIARATLGLAQRGFDNTIKNTAEYFAHETGDVLPRAEAEEFLAAVDRLREDVDRAAARLDAMISGLETKNEGVAP